MEYNNYKSIRRVLWIIFIANMAVAIIKIVVGKIINSTAIEADGMHSLTDGSSNIIGIVGIKLASKPEDKEHPYGHYKIETLAAGLIGVMLFFIGINVVNGAVERLKNPVEMYISIERIIIFSMTLLVNIFISVYEYKRGKSLSSQILVSDSLHTRSDVFVTLGVIVALIGMNLGLPPIIDPIISLAVAVVIFKTCYEILKPAIAVLLDHSVIHDKDIKRSIESFEQVKDIHKIRSRGTQNDIYVDMHILIDPDTSIEESHMLCHEIEKQLQIDINKNIHVIAHVEPYYNDNDPRRHSDVYKI